MAVLTAIGLALVPGLREMRAAWPGVSHIRAGWLLSACACQIGVYLSLAGLLGVGLRSVGYRVPAARLVYIALVFLFANRALPGPAVAGLASLVYLLRRRTVPAAISQVVAGTFYIADYASFFVLALLALGFSRGAVASPAAWAAAALVVAAASSATVFLLRSGATVTRALDRSVRAALRVSRHPDPALAAGHVKRGMEGFYARWAELTRQPGVFAVTCLWGLAMHLCETATVYCGARSLDAPVSFSAAAASYVAGNVAAIVSFLPGGLGFFEGAMAATLHRFGQIPLGPALTATVLYRFLSLWLPVPATVGALRGVLRARHYPEGGPE